MPLSSDALLDSYNIILSNPCYGVKYGISFINTGMVIAQLHNDFPDATDLEIHTAYLNSQSGTYEQILANAEQFLEEGDLSYPVSNWGDEIGSSADGGQGDEETSSGGSLLGH